MGLRGMSVCLRVCVWERERDRAIEIETETEILRNWLV